MKKYRLLTALLSLTLLACLSGVEGQYMQYTPQQGEVIGQVTPYSTESVGYPTTAQTSQVGQTTDQYSQYYTMGPAPSTHITSPQQINISGNIPATIYFGQQQQPVAYSQYRSSPTYASGDSLWIKGSASWAQYASVPQGAIVPLLAISPNGGSGYISEVHPNGQMYNYNYFFYPYSLMSFYSDTPGRHTLSFVVAGQPSNQVVIDVTGTYNPPSYYNPPTYTYPSYTGYYPDWSWGSWWGDGGFGFGDEFGEGGGFEGGEAGEAESHERRESESGEREGGRER
ncbi:MAG: hypothetical protein LUQ22_06015 [Methanotrichaceae archaeon]|nr:hypothetical protein [Methanotrichaceae archaeon]